MNKLLLTALVAIGRSVSARANIHVVVSIRNQTAWLVDHDRILMTSPVSTARRGMHTPTGRFQSVGERCIAYQYYLPRVNAFLHAFEWNALRHACRLFAGISASHGCIRMPKDKAVLFFKVVIVGTSVRILPN